MNDETIIHGCSLQDCPEVELAPGVQSDECALCGEVVERAAVLANMFAQDNKAQAMAVESAIDAIPGDGREARITTSKETSMSDSRRAHKMPPQSDLTDAELAAQEGAFDEPATSTPVLPERALEMDADGMIDYLIGFRPQTRDGGYGWTGEMYHAAASAWRVAHPHDESAGERTT